MNSNALNHIEVDERAFAIFILDGLYYLLQQDFPCRQGYIIEFCNRLWTRWQEMGNSEKDPYWERAIEEIRHMRRNSRADIYREVMREADQEDPDSPRRFSRRFLDRSS